MKMMNLIDGIFWGILLIALGVWFLVRRYVPVNIPVIRIIIAVLFVYLGVRVLVRGPSVREKNTVVFSQSEMSYGTGEKGNEYNMIFSSGSVDLTGIPVGERSVSAEVNVIFGSGTLRLSPTVPARCTCRRRSDPCTTPTEGRSRSATRSIRPPRTSRGRPRSR